MEKEEYKEFEIEYFPESFKSGQNPLEDVISEFKVLNDEKVVKTLKFLVPSPLTLTIDSERLLDKALEKTHQVIDQGIENLKFNEFDFISGEFTEVVDLTDSK